MEPLRISNHGDLSGTGGPQSPGRWHDRGNLSSTSRSIRRSRYSNRWFVTK